MAEVFTLPMLGNSMEEGTILQWFKQEGEAVRKGEALLEVMSDKANFEVESPADGVVRKIMVLADSAVPVHTPIAIIGGADEPIDALLQGAGTAPAAAADAVAAPAVAAVAAPTVAEPPAPTGSVAISPRAQRVAAELGIGLPELAGRGTGPEGRITEKDVREYAAVRPPEAERVRMTPLAAKMAGDLGVSVSDLGASGRVTADDVKRAADAAKPAPAKAAPSAGPAVAEIIPFRGLRKMTADTVTKSRFTAPHITLNMEIDVTETLAVHAKLVPIVQKSHEIKLTITDLLIKAVAKSLSDHPICNAALIGDEIRVYGDRNIGVAVATPTGLVVPVIKQADTKSVGDISKELKSLVQRARDGKQTQDDMAGGTFTITNIGMFGVDSFDPIIVPPQACILGVCRVAKKPLVINDQIAIRSVMTFSLSLDHRVLDGVPGAKFLLRLKELLEEPLSIFI